MCTSKLMKIARGDVVGAKNHVNRTDDNDVDMEESEGSHISSSTLQSGLESESGEQTRQGFWTSVEYIEAMSVLKEFMGTPGNICKRCDVKNPKISKPTFGSFRMVSCIPFFLPFQVLLHSCQGFCAFIML